MRPLRSACTALALLSTALATAATAEPILRGGIGLQTCEKIATDIKPGMGFDHLPNALMFYWVQGYLSAANIHLINEYSNYVDVGKVSAETILPLVAEFCKSNPDKRPVNALDKFIQDAKKIEIKEAEAFDPWEQ
jgi:hypothetical protein